MGKHVGHDFIESLPSRNSFTIFFPFDLGPIFGKLFGEFSGMLGIFKKF